MFQICSCFHTLQYLVSDLLLFSYFIVSCFRSAPVFILYSILFQACSCFHTLQYLVSGLLLFSYFIILANSAFLTSTELNQFDDLINALSLAATIISSIQAVLQTIFTIDALQKHVITQKQQSQKPGRGIITFLIICNVALWIFKTFQVKEVALVRLSEFYGIPTWPIILNVNLPFMLFFRFHSSVCLADIWVSAYKCEKTHGQLKSQ